MKFQYPMIEPPFEMKPYNLMNKAESKQHFEWFVSLSAPRRELLQRAIEAMSGPAPWFDYTRESLVPLWGWAMNQFGVQVMTDEQRKEYRETTPDWLQKVQSEPTELTNLTKTLVIDIGFYLAEVFIRAYPPIRWDLWEKKAGPCNEPYLTGFKAPLVPKDLVRASARTAIDDNPGPELLQRKYDIWDSDFRL